MVTRTAESRSRKVGAGENTIFQWLVERGEHPERQFPVGRCNVDIAIGSIAVEIERVGFNPFCWPRAAKRIKYLSERGWSVISILVSVHTDVLLPCVADKVVAIAQTARQNPTAPREHWVIRGCGEVAARAGDDFADTPLIPASVSCPHHGATYMRPPH